MIDDPASGGVLVTGGTGFIGCHLVARLVMVTPRVRVLSRGVTRADPVPGVEYVSGDIRDPAAARAATFGIDTVFHLAAWNGSPDPGQGAEACRRTNVDGTRHLLDAAGAAGVRRLVHFSSVKATGETSEGAPGDTPADLYGQSRLDAETIAMRPREDGLEVCCLRLPMVWGPGHRGNLYRMLAAIDRGRFPPLPPMRNKRSLVHVSDVVEAALLAAARPRAAGRTYTVTDGGAYSGSYLYEALVLALGQRLPRWRVPLFALTAAARVGDAARRIVGRPVGFDSSVLGKIARTAYYQDAAIGADLGYCPAMPFERGLPTFVAWYRTTTQRDGATG